MNAKRWTPFTPEEDRTIHDLFVFRKRRIADIAAALHRDASSVRSRAITLGFYGQKLAGPPPAPSAQLAIGDKVVDRRDPARWGELVGYTEDGQAMLSRGGPVDVKVCVVPPYRLRLLQPGDPGHTPAPKRRKGAKPGPKPKPRCSCGALLEADMPCLKCNPGHDLLLKPLKQNGRAYRRAAV